MLLQSEAEQLVAASEAFGRITVPLEELEGALKEGEALAAAAGLKLYRVPTPEGCDVYACPSGEPEVWRLEFVAGV